MANDAFKALAHRIRQIVERLRSGASTVVSRHLKMLEEAGLVSRVVDGRSPASPVAGGACRDPESIENQRERWERLFDVAGAYPDGAEVSTSESRYVRASS
jgi:DNA-binding transcriptional ArsR family regulator